MVDPELTRGCLLFALGDGQWELSALRLMLETMPEKTAMDGLEVEYDFPNTGRRTMLLNACKVPHDNNPTITILLAFSDEKEELLCRHFHEDNGIHDESRFDASNIG